MTIRRATFAPSGLGPLALEPQAFGASFDVVVMAARTAAGENTAERDAVQVVPVRGPLMHHDNDDFGSYDALLAVVRSEIAFGTKAIVLDFDTPGGLVSGVFETARAIQAECRAAGVQLVAYVGSQCCSAGYALACAASLIVAPPASTSGSIGVIEALTDATRQANMMGLRFTLIASGARKTDGNPMIGITPEAVEARQRHVDDLADEFFGWVAQNRPMTVDDVRALEAGSFAGKRALSLKLVDRVQDLEALKKDLARALKAPDDQSQKPPAAKASEATSPEGPPKMSAARKALQAICDDDKASDEDKKEAATALEALGDGDGDEEKPDDKDTAEGEDDSDKDEDKKDAEAAKAAAASNPLLAKALGIKPQAKVTVQSLLATRPDFDANLRAALASQPLSVVRHAVRTVPKQAHTSPLATARAGLNGARPSGVKPTPGTAPTQAAAQAGGPTAGAEEVKPAFKPKTFTLTDKGHTQSFSVVRPRA